MNFNELMNDDTCQILLAIIVGIVICYFIFGAGSGSCNRDGFSVGGQSCLDTQISTVDCSRLASRGESACKSAGCGWVPARHLPGAVQPACDAYLLSLADTTGADGPCHNVTIGNLGGNDSNQACCDAIRNNGGCDISNIDQPLSGQINEEQIICQREFPPATTAAGSCVGQPGQSNTAACQAFNSQTVQNRQHLCGEHANCMWVPQTDPAAGGAGGQSLPVEEIRERNIRDSIKNMIRKVAIGNLNQNIPQELDNIHETSATSFNRLFHIGRELNMEFIILVNTDNVVSLNKRDFIDLINNIYISSPEVDNSDTQKRIKLGNMFDPYARLSADDKKEIYCSKNTLTTSNDGQEKYDQLLKMRSTDEVDLSGNLSCAGQDGWESTTNKMYGIPLDAGSGMGIMTEYGNMINHSLEIPAGMRWDDGARANMITAIDGVLDITSIGSFPRYNKNQMVISDKFDISDFPYDRIAKPKYIEIVIKQSIFNIRGDRTQNSNMIGGGNYKLLFMDGMSSNGTPYNERIDAFNQSNLYDAYYKNLFFVQYLIFKIFLGTGRYVPRLTSFLVTDPGKRNNDIGTREYDPPPDWYDNQDPDGALNNMCTSSGRDYLVLGLLKDGMVSGSRNKHTIGQRPTAFPPRTETSIDRNGSIFTQGANRNSTFDFTPQSQEEYLDQYPVPAPAPAPATPAAPATQACNAIPGVNNVFATGQGCEWINPSLYNHKQCEDFVTSDRYVCETGVEEEINGVNRTGLGYCRHKKTSSGSAMRCTEPLPNRTGVEDLR